MRRAGIQPSWTALLSVGAVLAACAAPTGQPGPSATESSNPPVQTGYEEIGCREVTLIGPDGERLNLTGLWGEPGAYPFWNVQHVGDCLFLVSLPYTDESDPLGYLRGSQQQEMCEGVLHTDFTVDLRCVQFSSIRTYAGWDRTIWEIVFSKSGEVQILPCHGPSQQLPCLVPPFVRYEYWWAVDPAGS